MFRNYISLWLFIVILHENLVDTAQTANLVEEPERKMSKRDVSYYPPPPGYPATTSAYPSPYPSIYSAPTTTYSGYEAAPQQTYYYPVSYCPTEAPATQPPECDSNDQPLSTTPSQRKNCTCSWANSPSGCTLRLCTTADTCAVACNRFSCICNGMTASPSYCKLVLPYPNTAMVPYTPTPAGGTPGQQVFTLDHAHTHVSELQKQGLLLKASQLAKEQQIMKALEKSQSSTFSNQDQLIQALVFL